MITTELSPLLGDYVSSRFNRVDFYWQDDDNYIQIIDTKGEAKNLAKLRLDADRQEEQERRSEIELQEKAELIALKEEAMQLESFEVADPSLAEKLHVQLKLLVTGEQALQLEMFSGERQFINKLFRSGSHSQWMDVELDKPLIPISSAELANNHNTIVALVRGMDSYIATYVHDIINGAHLHLDLSNPENRNNQIDRAIHLVTQAGGTQLKFAPDTENNPYSRSVLEALVNRVSAYNAAAQTSNKQEVTLVFGNELSPAKQAVAEITALLNLQPQQVVTPQPKPASDNFVSLEHGMQAALSVYQNPISIQPQLTPGASVGKDKQDHAKANDVAPNNLSQQDNSLMQMVTGVQQWMLAEIKKEVKNALSQQPAKTDTGEKFGQQAGSEEEQGIFSPKCKPRKE